MMSVAKIASRSPHPVPKSPYIHVVTPHETAQTFGAGGSTVLHT